MRSSATARGAGGWSNEVGIEPGAELRALEQAILRHDAGLAHLRRARRLRGPTQAAAARRRRRTRAGGCGRWGLIAVAGRVAAVTRERPRRGGRADSRQRDRRRRRRPPAAPRLDPARLAAGSDRLRRRLGLGRVPRLALGRSHLAGVAAGRRLDHTRGARTEPCRRRPGGVGSRLGTDRPVPDARPDRPDVRQRLARAPPAGRRARRHRLPHRPRQTLLVAPRTGRLTRIDARSGRTLERRDPNAAPVAAALGFGSSWLAYREANLVVRVDSLGALTQIPVGREPSAIAVGRRFVWVANAIDGTVESIDPSTGATVQTIRGRRRAGRARGRRRQHLGGGRRRGKARPDRRAHQSRHRRSRSAAARSPWSSPTARSGRASSHRRPPSRAEEPPSSPCPRT